MRDIFLGLTRFDDLAVDLGISRNLLTVRLAALIEHGVVEHQRYSERPPRDHFVLTQAGRELVPVFTALTTWGDRWATPPDALCRQLVAQARLDRLWYGAARPRWPVRSSRAGRQVGAFA
ncbi:MAG: winged helix-turn-helix transcriptional regulator [Chloroflexota bacterium]